MTLYVTVDEFTDQGIPSEGLGVLSADTVETALEQASETLDSYFRKRFLLPLLSWGGDVKRAVISIACFNLLNRRGFNPQVPGHAAIARAYDDALKWLRDVASGDVEPAVTDSSDSVDEAGTLTSSETAHSFRFYTGRGEQSSG